MERTKVLFIDDEKDFCELMKEHLEALGEFDVYTAVSGKTGLDIAKKIKPRIIVLDVLMPEMSGLDVLKKLKEDRATLEIPVIMLSAKDDDTLKMKGAQLFDELYLTKPIEAGELNRKIEEIIKRRGQALGL